MYLHEKKNPNHNAEPRDPTEIEFEKEYSECIFKPKLCEKSIKIVRKREKS